MGGLRPLRPYGGFAPQPQWGLRPLLPHKRGAPSALNRDLNPKPFGHMAP